MQRLAINGKRHDIGLGGWPLTSLKEARERAFANRKLARDGGDPLAVKRRAAARLRFVLLVGTIVLSRPAPPTATRERSTLDADTTRRKPWQDDPPQEPLGDA